MTAQHAFKWLAVGGALCVGGVFADLQRSSVARVPPVLASRGLSTPLPTAQPGTTTTAATGLHVQSQVTFTFWNVEWFPGRKPNASEQAKAEHIANVAPVIERLDPDVLGLEEVADGAAAQILVNRLKGFRVDACTEFTRADGEPTHQQTVLCSRLPLIQARWESWKLGAGGVTPRRGFVFGAYQPEPGKVLLVYGLHLKSNRDDEAGGLATNIAMREESARQLLAHEQAMVQAYARAGEVVLTVVGGDLNTSLDDPRFEKETTLRSWLAAGFRWAWVGVPLGDRLTLPSEGRYPATCFDHVFLSGAGSAVLGVGIEPTGKEASDHRPVTVKIGL